MHLYLEPQDLHEITSGIWDRHLFTGSPLVNEIIRFGWERRFYDGNEGFTMGKKVLHGSRLSG